MNLAIVGLSSLLFLSSCASRPTASQNLLQSFLRQNSLSAPKVVLQSFQNYQSSEDFFQISILSKGLMKVIINRFQNTQNALEHMSLRRAMLSSAYKNYVEPYYGLVEKKSCVLQSEFSADFKNSPDGDISFSVILPSDDNFNLFDCDNGEPPFFVKYLFLKCSEKNAVVEVRTYLPISAGTDSFSKLDLACD